MEKLLCRLLVLLAAVNIASCQKHDRIVGGFTGDIANYPWLVNLRYDFIPACGGSIISAQWILTACHCFPTDHELKYYDVIAATTNLEPPDSSTQTVLIEAVYKQPLYTEDAYSADIALVKLKTPLNLGRGVGIITLLAAGITIPAGMSCVITGWGNILHGETLQSPKPLQAGYVQVISRRTCQCLHNINPSSNSITYINSDMMCAGYKEGTVDACQGDSGGPLSCNINGKWYQVGVVSWGDKCGTANRPGVYIMPNVYIDWIKGLVPDCQVESVTINQEPIPDEETGCRAADGTIYPYSKGTVVLVTFISLPLYWLSGYLLTNL